MSLRDDNKTDTSQDHCKHLQDSQFLGHDEKWALPEESFI